MNHQLIDETRLMRKLEEFLQHSVDVAAATQATTSTSAAHTNEAWIHSTLPIQDHIFRQIVRECVTKLEGRLPEMRALLEESDWQELASAAHWLKGSGGTAGFNDLTAPSSRLERAAKDEAATRAGTLAAPQ